MARARRFLVTGGAGFIGSHLTEMLLERGDAVLSFDSMDAYYDVSLKQANCARAAALGDFELVRGDIRDHALLTRTLHGFRPDVVVHLAALAGVRPSLREPERYHQVNVQGTLSVLEACREHGVPLVNASSSSVYGRQGDAPTPETHPTRPISPYGLTKLQAEEHCANYAQRYGMAVYSLRFFTVFGPRQRPDMAISKFARAIASGETVQLYGDGSSRRDYTYVQDVVRAIAAAANRTEPGHTSLNIGTGRDVALRDLVEQIAGLYQTRARLAFLPAHPSDPPRTLADIQRATRLLGYRPETSLSKGLAAVVRAPQAPEPAHRSRPNVASGLHLHPDPWLRSTTA